MFSYRNDWLETKAKEPMGPNRNKSRTTWQTLQLLATGLLSLSIQQCALQTTHCTLQIASAPAPVYSKPHNENCTLHTACLFCMLQIYHFTLPTIKSCLSWTSRWWLQNWHWYIFQCTWSLTGVMQPLSLQSTESGRSSTLTSMGLRFHGAVLILQHFNTLTL